MIVFPDTENLISASLELTGNQSDFSLPPVLNKTEVRYGCPQEVTGHD